MTRRLLTTFLGLSLLGAGVLVPQPTCLAGPSATLQWQARCCCPAGTPASGSCRTACRVQAADQPAVVQPALSAPASLAALDAMPHAAGVRMALEPDALALLPAAAPPHVPLRRYLLTHTFRL